MYFLQKIFLHFCNFFVTCPPYKTVSAIQEYVNNCVYTFVEAAKNNEVPQPNLITEGGRSLAAHHAVMIMEVLGTVELPVMPEEFEVKETDHPLAKDLYEIWDNLSSRSMLEDWRDGTDTAY